MNGGEMSYSREDPIPGPPAFYALPPSMSSPHITQPLPRPSSSGTTIPVNPPRLPSALVVANPDASESVVPVVTPKRSHKARKPKAKIEKPTPVPAGTGAGRGSVEVMGRREEVEFEEPPLTKKEKKHKEMMDRLEKLNRDFVNNKEKIFADKVIDYKEKAQQLLSGTHPEFDDVIKRLEDDRHRSVANAESFRDYQMECAAMLYKHEHDTIIAEFKVRDKEAVKEKMLEALEEKKRKIRDDRANFDINQILQDTTLEDHRTLGTRKATRSHAAKNPEEKKEKRRKIQALPGIIVLTPDEVALADLSLIRRQIPVQAKKPPAMIPKRR
ncbi:Sds3-like-domain-containing protein [Fimicolochytrium jonesii]|uniref:Sds3-like-domain-containing protein n=1 Tax=Fimicolochytrium jonesii TaxID=1396493 RepID=UPI0022FEB5A9|nr:Sds3-like-domain-containing protein [Fimicolochytrium jonesii]KAI8820414.1 Sds3-like-domain-containing protein [Fimicolochytrium jonesii]